MSDNSELNPTQTEVTSSEQLVGLVPIEGEEQGIDVHLIAGDGDEDFFGAQAIELNGERHVIVSQAQDPETGELLLVLRGENGEHIAIQSEALSSMVQASGGEHIQVAVETNEEAALTLTSDISSLSQSVSTEESNPLSTTSLSALPSIIANIPSQTQTTTAPTNVVQAIDTPRVSQEEQPSTLTNVATVMTSVPSLEDQTNEVTNTTTVSNESTFKKEEIVLKNDESLTQTVIEEEKTRKVTETVVTPKETIEENPTVIPEIDSIVSQPEPEVKELTQLNAPEILKSEETEAVSEEMPKTVETKTFTETIDNIEQNESTSNGKIDETNSTAMSVDPTPVSVTSLSTLSSTSDQMTTSSTESTTISTPLPTTESISSITSATVSVPEEKVSTTATETVNSAAELGFGNTAVIQVQDSGNETSIEQLMANAMLTADGNYVLMAQTEDGQVTGLPSELNLSDVINAGAAGGQTFLIETPEGLVACTASTSGEDGSIQLIPTETSDIENAVISSAQTSGTSVESHIIQAISGGQPMTYTFNSTSGCLEVTAVNTNQNQVTSQKASRGGRGNRSNKSKAVSSVSSMGQTLLLTAETETPTVLTKPSTQTPARNRGGRAKGSRISGSNDSSDSPIISNPQQLRANSKTTNEGKSSTTVNSLSSETSVPPGPSQLAASRRTYSKKSNIVWITPDASQGANNTTFATVATASVKSTNAAQKQKTTPNCNSTLTKGTDETTTSRVRTPSPTKTTVLTSTTLATKTTAVAPTRSTSPVKASASTPLQITSTITKPVDQKTSSNKAVVTTIANKSTTQTASEKKETSVPKTTASITATKSVTASKMTALKTNIQSSVSRGQTPNLTIQSPVTSTETTTKTTIRVSDITATKTSVETPSPKTGIKTVVTVPSATKTKTIVTKSGATTIPTSVKPIAPTKTISHSKKPSAPTASVDSSVSSVKKPISTISSTKSTSKPITSENKDSKSSEIGTPIEESNISAKQPKPESTQKTVSTPIAVKSTVSSDICSAKSTSNSAEKSNKKLTEKIISNRSVETRHSARLSPTKHLKSENNKEMDLNTKLALNSSDLIESKVDSSKSVAVAEDSKKKSELEIEDKKKTESQTTQIETSPQKTLQTEEKTNKSDTELQTTEYTEDNKSVRKSRRSSRNTTNVEENKKEVKIVDEIKTIETKTKEIKDKNIKENPKEIPIESVSTRRAPRKREVTAEDKIQELSTISSGEALTTPPSVSTPTNEVKSSTQRMTRASSGKKPEVKSTPNEEKVSKTADSKAFKEKEIENKVESEVKSDFDRIVKETIPTEKGVEKRPEKAVEKNDEMTETIPSKTTETTSLPRSVKKRVQFEIKEKPEEEKVSKSSDSKEKTPEVSTPALTRRSLRSSTPQVVNQSTSDVQSDQKDVSDDETKTDKQINENNNKTPQRFSTRKRKEVKSVEMEVKEVTKSPKKSKKFETNNDIESAITDGKHVNSTDSSAMVRLRDRRTQSIKRPEPRNSMRETVRHSIETSDPLSRINRRQSLIHSYVDKNEWHEKEDETRRKTISSLSDLRSPNECYDYSTNECCFYIRHQSASLTPKQSTGNYLCQKCGFHTTRINNLVIHHRDQCSYVKNQVIQQWQTELQKRVRPSDNTLTASTSSPEKRRKTETNDELNNILDKNTDQSEDDSEEEEIATNDTKSNQNPTISDIDAMLMGSDDEDLLSIDNIEKPKREFGFSEDDIVWVETNSTHWPSLVSKVFPREKKAMIRLIDSPWSKKSLKADISSISLFDSAEVNKQYLRDGRKGSNGDLLVKAVQKAEEFLRKKCLGSELSAAKFFDQIDSDLSEANADDDERLTSNTKDNVSVDSKETAKTSESLLDNSLAAVGSNGDDSEVDKMPESNEAIAQWKEKRRQQNVKLLQCIKEGKVETHLVGVYRESIPSERHQKFKSGSESEKNQLKHVPWFGPIDDEEQQEEIYDYCSQLFKSNFKTDGSFDTVAYIFEVWVPEAIVKAISRVRRIELKESESIFAKGVILSKTEKDELTKEIQKEAEKQMTSQTSCD